MTALFRRHPVRPLPRVGAAPVRPVLRVADACSLVALAAVVLGAVGTIASSARWQGFAAALFLLSLAISSVCTLVADRGGEEQR